MHRFILSEFSSYDHTHIFMKKGQVKSRWVNLAQSYEIIFLSTSLVKRIELPADPSGWQHVFYRRATLFHAYGTLARQTALQDFESWACGTLIALGMTLMWHVCMVFLWFCSAYLHFQIPTNLNRIKLLGSSAGVLLVLLHISEQGAHHGRWFFMHLKSTKCYVVCLGIQRRRNRSQHDDMSLQLFCCHFTLPKNPNDDIQLYGSVLLSLCCLT